jgi:mono/diheme cytochrome c family protein
MLEGSMKRAVLAALAGAAMLAACGQTTRSETVEEMAVRGKYLVENIGGCNDCHTPMTPQGPDMSQSLQGAALIFEPTAAMPWAPTAPEIAGLPPGYTEEQFIAFLQTGVRPDGSRPLPPMPAFRFNEADARAVAAYIRTMPKKATPAAAGAPAQ